MRKSNVVEAIVSRPQQLIFNFPVLTDSQVASVRKELTTGVYLVSCLSNEVLIAELPDTADIDGSRPYIYESLTDSIGRALPGFNIVERRRGRLARR